ncbi:MAG: solute carrier family 23 protein [Lentisphaerota bacterium]
MPKKPANLIYGVDDKPGWGASFLLGLQHTCVQSIAFIFPVVIIGVMGGTAEQARNLICMAMIASGVATILQGLNKGPVGSGYLCPLVNGPAFLSASLMAVKTGGLSLVFGMTAVGAVFEALFSRVITRMRAFFPSEVTGTVVTMVGIEIIAIAVPRFCGVDSTHAAPSARAILVATITFLCMAGFTVWGRGALRLYSVLLGLVIGYIAAFLLGVLTREHAMEILRTPWFTHPRFGEYGMTFKAALVVPFVVATLSSALKTMGDLTTCQKINDTDWRRPDMKVISRGVLACAVGNLVSGVLGALGQSVSSSNIGLSIGNGATSRRIAYTNGLILILLAFVPKLASFFVIMPTPIMGASLIFAVSFMIVAGIQILTSRMLDARKTFVIGTSIVFGLSVDLVPQLYQQVHPWLKPLFSSSLSVAAISAVVLNLLFRIGIGKHKVLELKPATDSSVNIFTFMERQGGLWGARRDVIYSAISAMNEFMEAVALGDRVSNPMVMDVGFDEFNLDVTIRYEGQPLEFPGVRPDKRQLRTEPGAVTRLAGFLVRQYADKLTATSQGAVNQVVLHFDH